MKIKLFLGWFIACLLLGYVAVVLACDDCPDCPDCYTSTGEPPNCNCIYDCNEDACESCISGSCQVCNGDPNQFCCDGNCCDSDECEECIDGNCVTIDINSITVDANSVCVGCNVTFTVITDPCGYEDDVEWSAPGGDPCTGTGETFTTSWDTAGIHTATASLCDSNDSNDVTVVEVASLEPNEPNDPNAITEIDDGDEDPNTRSFIVCIVDPNHDPNVVTVIATPNPDVNEEDLPDSWSFTGGTDVNDFVHTVDRTTAAKTVLTCSCGTSSKTTTIYVLKLEILNPVNPNKGTANDSDDYFFRGLSEPNVMIYYDFLPTDLTATSVKLLIKDGGGSTLRDIALETSTGANKLAEWDGKDTSGDYYDEWDFRAEIQAVIGGNTFDSNEHPIADLLYKHRPMVYIDIDANELSGPQDVNCMMKHADLYDWGVLYHTKVASAPLDFNDLRDANDTTDRFQDLDDSKRQVNTEPNTVYCRGTIANGHAFLQYWHFEPSSSLPESTDVFHEGDWEMFQIAVEPNTDEKILKPIAITASQHYYGQTIRWAENGNDPNSQDQDYVGKSGHQPKVYIALNSHATYFRQGYFRCSMVPGDTSNHGLQYLSAPNDWPIKDDKTGNNLYDYNLRIFHDPMISHWQGYWGKYETLTHGPESPKYRETAVNMWDSPKSFNNYYLKLESYPSGDPAHPECEIP